MIKDWLKKMLTPAKQESEIWTGYVDVLQEMLEQTVEPIIQRIDARKSLFSMKGDDLDTRMNELGQFFSIRAKKASSKPILLAQRIDEIHFKGTDRPLSATFWREFDNLPAKWEPLYAPVDQKKAQYGDFFVPKSGIPTASQQYGGFFLTSRGKISLSVNALYQTYGGAQQADLLKRIQQQFDEVIQPLIPLEVVCDGFLLYLEFTLFEYAPTLNLRSNPLNLAPANSLAYGRAIVAESHFDDPSKGMGAFSSNAEKITIKTQSSMPMMTLTQQPRNLDYETLRFDETPLDFWPLDAFVRPNIYPQISPTAPTIKTWAHDPRIQPGATSTTIDTMGASYLLIRFDNGTERYEHVAGQSTFTLSVPAAVLATVSTIIYSLS